MNNKDYLAARIGEHLRKNYEPFYTDFLDERTQAVLLDRLKASGEPYAFWGGFPDAQRKMLCIYPEYAQPEWPLAAIAFSGWAGLEHRHVLGNLMALGVERETIGDIFISEQDVQIMIPERLADFFKTNLTRINTRSVKIELRRGEAILAYTPEYKNGAATASSNRLDAVAAAVFHLSRSAAVQALQSGLLLYNHNVPSKLTAAVSPGDTLSMRAKGKVKIDSADETTKKGRLKILYKEYK